MPSERKVKARQEKPESKPSPKRTAEISNKINSQIKTVYLIRHGQSQGQTAREMGLDRNRDPSLIDCGLSSRGVRQALGIPSHFTNVSQPELVISSPLTRALQTSALGFPQQEYNQPILVHYGLREIGSAIPENLPRGDIPKVLHYIRQKHRHLTPCVDGDALKPANWPDAEDATPIEDIFRWMAQERQEETIAVVCHFNVIRKALAGFETRPQNAVPIPCHLHPDGTLVPIQRAKS